MATAVQEGTVSNARMQELTDMHAQDISKFIRKLITKELLVQQGHGRGTTYILSERFNDEKGDANHEEKITYHEERISYHEESPDNHEEDNRTHKEENAHRTIITPDYKEDGRDKFLEIAEKARTSRRLDKKEMENIILRLCKERYMTSREIAEITTRNLGSISGHLRTLVKDKQLELKYPNSLNHKYQAYKTKI